jgi:steroid delta-isomerase-like uncharacterized protein
MVTANNVHREYIDAILRHDFEMVERMFHPEYTYTGGDGQESKGPEAGLAVAKMFTSAFPDLSVKFNKIHVAGQTAIGEFVATGTHKGDLMGIKPTGKRASVTVCNVIEVRDGKIYREREYFDSMTMLVQLGVVAAPGHS